MNFEFIYYSHLFWFLLIISSITIYFGYKNLFYLSNYRFLIIFRTLSFALLLLLFLDPRSNFLVSKVKELPWNIYIDKSLSMAYHSKPSSVALVSGIDFTPTILDITGTEYNAEDFDGKSFLPVLLGKKEQERILYFELGYARAIRKGPWKYIAIRYPDFIKNMSLDERKNILDTYNNERRRKYLNIVTEDPSAPFSHFNALPGGGDAERVSTGKKPSYYAQDQLYNLDSDPNELNNLFDDPKYKEKSVEMKKELQSIIDTLPGHLSL